MISSEEKAQEAIDKLADEFSGDPNLADALYECAKRYEWVRGRYEEAQPIYQLIIQQCPDSSYARQQLDLARTNVISLIESGDYILAQQALDRLLARFPAHPDLARTLDGIAGRYENAERYEEAATIYQKIVSDYPGTDYALTAQKKLTILEIKSGDDPAAQAALDTLIADFNENPGLSEAVFQIGEHCYNDAFGKENEARVTEAEESFTKAIAVWQRIITDLPPSFFTPQAYHFSAVCYRRMGKYEKAIELYQVVVDNWPNFQYAWVAHFRIAECYEKLESLGRIPTQDAAVQIRHACQQILTNYPDCMGVGAARNFLKRWTPENSN